MTDMMSKAKSRHSDRGRGTRPTDARAGFAVLMEACKYCSLGQLTDAMFEVGAVQEEYVMRHIEHDRCLGVPPRKSLGVALSAVSPRWLRSSATCGLSAAIAHAEG
jgi:hypothetical protein